MGTTQYDLVTWNLWHGLTGQGYIKIKPLENPNRTQERNQAQSSFLESLHPKDVLCLQETNPVDLRAKHFLKYLKNQTWQSHFVADNPGCKVFGYGIPINLNSGLLTLTNKKRFYPLSINSVKLSGGPLDYRSPSLSIQIKENRWALITVFRDKLSGLDVTFINLHLHHKLGLSSDIMGFLEKMKREFKISETQFNFSVFELKKADERRKKEIQNLMTLLNQIKTDFIFILGDFNCDPDPLLKEYSQEWKSLISISNNKDSESSWSHLNPNNFLYTPHFPCYSEHDRKQMGEIIYSFLKEKELSSRQLDFIYFFSKSFSVVKSSSEVISAFKGLAVPLSDHSLVRVSVEIKKNKF